MALTTPKRTSLEGQHFHVIVIGGGINGVAIARECARRGRHVLLVEQHDFAAGTTSRATRIIHGGLRYLEHGEIGLVRESLREREKLLRERPHLVHPVHFLLALDDNSRRSAFSIRTGLWLYRRFGGQRLGIDNSKIEQYKLERLLDAGKKWSIFNFEDAQCEFPERLVAEWLVEAVRAGAVTRNHTQVLAVDVSYGRAKGVLLRDQLSGKEERVKGTWIINATGPWADRVCQRSRINTGQPMVGGVRGSHIVVPRFSGAPGAAVYTEAVDGRPIFVIPWNDQILVGTTDVPDRDDPSRVKPSADEIEYLLRSLRGLFPRCGISQHDIKFSFAGIRPLPFSPKQDPSAVSRKLFLHDHVDDGAANMISIIGGKLTTAAQVARECAAKIGASGSHHSPDAVAVSGDGFNAALENLTAEIAASGGISENSARAIVEWHGRGSLAIAHMAISSAELRAPLCEHSEHIVAEAVDAFINECAVTLADVLLRRVPVALGPCWSDACSRNATNRIAGVMGWNEEQAAAELEHFEMERTMFLRKPTQAGMMIEAAAD